jgi:hypothetical protein
MKNLVMNCFSIRNNGGYKDIIAFHENEQLDEVGYHMFVEELADELASYNDLLDSSSKVDFTREDAIREAIREAKKATRVYKGYHVVNSVSYMETYDNRFDKLVAGEYPVKFA